MADDEEQQKPPDTLESLFDAYSNYWTNAYPNPKANDMTVYDKILLSQADFWMEKAEIMNSMVSYTDTGLIWMEYTKARLDFDEFMEYLDELCKSKGLNNVEIKKKLLEAGPPEIEPTTVV